ncbi:hypothetical protein [Ekhidna sp.]|uniref:hypothetical protein n=1 Tax=Ekhidna sp. TaxID=2608089 RepID=UPI003298E8FE
MIHSVKIDSEVNNRFIPHSTGVGDKVAVAQLISSTNRTIQFNGGSNSENQNLMTSDTRGNLLIAEGLSDLTKGIAIGAASGVVAIPQIVAALTKVFRGYATKNAGEEPQGQYLEFINSLREIEGILSFVGGITTENQFAKYQGITKTIRAIIVEAISAIEDDGSLESTLASKTLATLSAVLHFTETIFSAIGGIAIATEAEDCGGGVVTCASIISTVIKGGRAVHDAHKAYHLPPKGFPGLAQIQAPRPAVMM